jgi:hypothetical protein
MEAFMDHALPGLGDRVSARPAIAGREVTDESYAPRAEDLFFEAGIILAVPLALTAVIDLCLLAAGIGS